MTGPFKVNFPREPLAQRVAALNRITGCGFQIDPENLKDREAPAIQGRYTSRLIARALAHNGLVASPIDGGFATYLY